VGAKRIEDLVVWQLGNELRKKVHALSANAVVAGDWRFRDQLRDAASSITRNIAEGFERYRSRAPYPLFESNPDEQGA
jgi:four helix bundle protein